MRKEEEVMRRGKVEYINYVDVRNGKRKMKEKSVKEGTCEEEERGEYGSMARG